MKQTHKVAVTKKGLQDAVNLLGGLETYIKPNSSVLIKVNLCSLKPYPTTTRLSFLNELIELINPITKNITVCESGNGGLSFKYKVKKLGYDMGLPSHVKLLNITQEDNPCDHFIALTNMKVNDISTVSLGIKNLLGMIPDQAKSKYHNGINETLANLAVKYHPTLTIIDAETGMEGKGSPITGTPVPMGLTIVGDSILATDWVGASVMGFPPYSIPHIRTAIKKHLGEPSNIQVLGETIEKVQRKFKPSKYTIHNRLTVLLSKIEFLDHMLMEMRDKTLDKNYRGIGDEYRALSQLKLMRRLRDKYHIYKVLNAPYDHSTTPEVDNEPFNEADWNKNPMLDTEEYDMVWNFDFIQRDPNIFLYMNGTYALVFTPSSTNPGNIFHKIFHRWRKVECTHPERGDHGLMTKRGLTRFMEQQGFQVLECGYVDLAPWPDTVVTVKEFLGISKGGGREMMALPFSSKLLNIEGLLKPFSIIFGHHLYCLAKRDESK